MAIHLVVDEVCNAGNHNMIYRGLICAVDIHRKAMKLVSVGSHECQNISKFTWKPFVGKDNNGKCTLFLSKCVKGNLLQQ